MADPNSEILNALCFDVDDLAYSLNVVKGTNLPTHYPVEQESYAVLEALDRLNIKATMFIPGYVARRFPSLVRDMDLTGHEMASHGYKHWTAKRLQPNDFREDASAGKKILEDILGKEVTTFKAPDWGIRPETLWAYDQLISIGFRVDHSAHPPLLKFLGRRAEDWTPFCYREALTVIPVTSLRLMGGVFPFNGGMYTGYLPIGFQIRHFRRLNRQGIPFNYYCHPYEFHPCGANRQTWKYRSFRAALYGLHFGKYREYITRLTSIFRFAPLRIAYSRFIPTTPAP
jgi:polysaccharide deacetylase family protein (PEP-CTERM system associated)